MLLRDYQQSAVECTINWLRFQKTPAIVSIPTGGGKTWAIAALIEHYKNERVLLVAHRKELLEQAGDVIHEPFGYYSASLGEKNLRERVTVANIQSIARAPLQSENPFTLIIIDECHLVPNNKSDSQYWNLLNSYPNAKIVGLSGTPYRTKGGKLDWGEVVYKIDYKTLLDAGYLCPLSNKLLADVTPDLSDVPINLGEYSITHIEKIMEDAKLLEASVKAIMAYSIARSSCLIFTVSIKHAALLLDVLKLNGVVSVEMVSSETPDKERDDIIERFKSGELRFLLNCELLLIGFDAPRIDAIFCLRPTKSRGLWQQMCGRGVRKYPAKQNCLLVDMSGNLKEHGGLGTPERNASGKEIQRAPGKICPECEEYVEFSTKQCNDCGYEFPITEEQKANHNRTVDTSSSPIYTGDIETYEVSHVTYKQHKSAKGNQTLMVQYHCGYGKYGTIAEFLSPQSTNEWARSKAQQFFKERGNELASPIESYSFEDLLFHASQLRSPTRIVVSHQEEFPRIKKYEWRPLSELLLTDMTHLTPEELTGEDQSQW